MHNGNAGKKKVWDVQLTVQKTAEEQPELVGAVFTIHPRQRPGGMCKIGRSTGVDFTEGKGVSLPKDWGVSTWHGKVRRPQAVRRTLVIPWSLFAALRPIPLTNKQLYLTVYTLLLYPAVHVRVRHHLLHRPVKVRHQAQRVRVRDMLCV